MVGCAIFRTATRPTSRSVHNAVRRRSAQVLPARAGARNHGAQGAVLLRFLYPHPAAPQQWRTSPNRDETLRDAEVNPGAQTRPRRARAAGLTSGRPGSSWSMATEPKPTSRPAIELAPPPAERGERWWPVAVAIVVVAGLHVILPARYRVQPAWVVPAVLLVLLAVLIVGEPGR